MDGNSDSTALDSVFDENVINIEDLDKQHLTMADLKKFVKTINTIPERELNEMEICAEDNETDENAPISMNFLYRFILNFTQGRNSFTEEDEEEGLANRTGDLTGCGGDISVMSLPDYDMILTQSKTMKDKNSSLINRNANLRSQLEAAEEEIESLKNAVSTMDKDLKTMSLKPDSHLTVMKLQQEKDDLLHRVNFIEDENMELKQKMRIAKDESDEYRHRLSLLQDRHDENEMRLSEITKHNGDLELVKQQYHIRCQDYMRDLEAKEELVLQKSSKNNDLQQKIRDMEEDYAHLLEEKRQLAINLKESQLEFSICRQNDSNISTPRKSSLEQELTHPSVDICNYPSPICGPNRLNKHQQFIQNNFSSLSVRSPTPEQITYEIAKALFSCEQSCQTQSAEKHSVATQTESATVNEDDFVAKLKSVMLNCQIKQDEIDSLESKLSQEKSRCQSLIMQLGVHQSRISALQNEVSKLTDSSLSVSESKFNSWSSKYFRTNRYHNIVPVACHALELKSSFSNLVNAMSLDCGFSYYTKHIHSKVPDAEISNYEDLINACEIDVVSRDVRLDALKKCRKAAHTIIHKNLLDIEEVLTSSLYNPVTLLHGGDAPTTCSQLSCHTKVIKNAINHIEHISQEVGAIEQENQQILIIRHLSEKLTKSELKVSELLFRENDAKQLSVLDTYENDCLQLGDKKENVYELFYESILQNRHNPREIGKVIVDHSAGLVKHTAGIAGRRVWDFLITLSFMLFFVYLTMDYHEPSGPFPC